MHLQARVPLSARPQLKPGQSVPSGVQAIPVLMPLQAGLVTPPLPPLLAAPPDAAPAPLLVPAELLLLPAELELVPPLSLEVPPIGTTVVPALPLLLPAPEELVPPLPSSGVLALLQPRAPDSTRNPADAKHAYTLIMTTSFS
jgi:hypothetical protein